MANLNKDRVKRTVENISKEVANDAYNGRGGSIPVVIIPDGATTVTQEQYDLLFPQDPSQQRPQILVEHVTANYQGEELDLYNIMFYFNGDGWSSFIYNGPIVVFELFVNDNLSIDFYAQSTYALFCVPLNSIIVEDTPNRVYSVPLRETFLNGKLFDEEAGQLLFTVNDNDNTLLAKSAVLDDGTYLKVTFDDYDGNTDTCAMTREFIQVGGGTTYTAGDGITITDQNVINADVLCFDMENYSTQSELNSGEWNNETIYQAGMSGKVCFITWSYFKAFVSYNHKLNSTYYFKLVGEYIEPGETSAGFGWDETNQRFFTNTGPK